MVSSTKKPKQAKYLDIVHNTLYVFMPHFLTLSNFSTATPRETSSVELPVFLFEDPNRDDNKKEQWTLWCMSSYQSGQSRHCMGHDNEGRVQCGHDGEPGGTWMLVCVLGKSTGCRLAFRQASSPGFHANVWNEHGDDKRAKMRGRCEIYVSKKFGGDIDSWIAYWKKNNVRHCGEGNIKRL